jgi:hypothetical protein
MVSPALAALAMIFSFSSGALGSDMGLKLNLPVKARDEHTGTGGGGEGGDGMAASAEEITRKEDTELAPTETQADDDLGKATFGKGIVGDDDVQNAVDALRKQTDSLLTDTYEKTAYVDTPYPTPQPTAKLPRTSAPTYSPTMMPSKSTSAPTPWKAKIWDAPSLVPTATPTYQEYVDLTAAPTYLPTPAPIGWGFHDDDNEVVPPIGFNPKFTPAPTTSVPTSVPTTTLVRTRPNTSKSVRMYTLLVASHKLQTERTKPNKLN